MSAVPKFCISAHPPISGAFPAASFCSSSWLDSQLATSVIEQTIGARQTDALKCAHGFLVLTMKRVSLSSNKFIIIVCLESHFCVWRDFQAGECSVRIRSRLTSVGSIVALTDHKKCLTRRAVVSPDIIRERYVEATEVRRASTNSKSRFWLVECSRCSVVQRSSASIELRYYSRL